MKASQHQQRALHNFAIDDGELLMGEQRVSEYFADPNVGPTFFYSTDAITRRVAAVRAALPPSVRLQYAIKANPYPPLLELMRNLVDGFDVASGGELRLARQVAGPDFRIGFAGPGKNDAELRAAVMDGCTIQVESPTEFERIRSLAAEEGCIAATALRINPDFELRGSGMKMSGAATPFGMPPDVASKLLPETPSTSTRFAGLHIYAGSQCLDATAISDAQEASLTLAASLLDAAPDHRVDINIGGGFGIPYFAQDELLDLDQVGMRLNALTTRFGERFPKARIVVELGRYLVGESGVYLTRVLDRKSIRGKIFLICDGGLHHHLAASGNFGQVIRRNYPTMVVNRLNESTTSTATVVGRLCTPLDVIASDIAIPDVSVGDIVGVFQSGAYGPTASPSQFLGHPPPVERLL
ncbi:MAG: pyridoxal-dependent decarboxylase, exosortase A system-associated [Pseudomonadota bacterium]